LKKLTFFTGLHVKLGAGIVGAGILYYVNKYRDTYLADKDAMYRHYVQLHPEDFPPPGLFIKYII
jgi:NADH dehydrogenase (ubiquinone) 1 subunit C2